MKKQTNKSSPLLFSCKNLLKGQCYEDFAVVSQFSAKIITLRLYS